jgi:predicted ArsR family transcriptional regulator
VTESVERQLQAAGALGHPLRRALYRYLCEVDREVGRDEAARAVGAGRDRVASHLDRLAEAGLLDVTFRRLSGRSGPGAGRPSKLYRPSSRQIEISVPPRRYGLAADVFAAALVATRVPPEVIEDCARTVGQELGQDAKRALTAGASRKRTAEALERLAGDHGFDPVRVGRFLTMTNCPFVSLVESRGTLVCQMNLSLIRGMLAGLGGEGMGATMVTPPLGRGCCVKVVLRPSKAGAPASGGG